jgi:hypothetical protein
MATRRPKRRARRFLQFSLRALLVFVLLVSLGMSWLAVRMAKARRQKEAVEAIRELGGIVLYDYNSDATVVISLTRRLAVLPVEPPGPAWAREILGVDFFSNVADVDMWGAQIGDVHLKHFRELSTLSIVDLSETQVTDAGLVHLEGLSNLTHLNLTRTRVTPEGVEKLQEALPDCEIVY